MPAFSAVRSHGESQERAPVNALETAGRRLPYVLIDLLERGGLATSDSRRVLQGDHPAVQ